MAKRFLVLIALLMLGFYVAGCADGDKSTTVTNPNPSVFAPTGSINGVVFDICAQAPVKDAVVSVSYSGRTHQVTTAANGGFAFDNVPANYQWQDNGDWEQEQGADEGYFVTCDLTKKTGYGYAVVDEVWVYFGDLGDGDNAYLGMNDQQTEGGSGADTPVDKLAASMTFEVGPLTSGLSGTIYDVTSGRAGTAATVALYYNGRLVGSTTASATGAFSFTNIMPAGSHYQLMVTKAGYEYASTPGKKVASADNSCQYISINCAVPCNATLAGVEVNLIANPAKDKTVPYIVSVATGGETDVIDGDVFPDLTSTDITSFVVTFNEAMVADRSLKTNAVTLASSFAVVVTSGGTHSGGGSKPADITSTIDILDNFTVTMTSAGVMTITPTYQADADLAATVIGLHSLPWDEDAATVAIGRGTYTVTFASSPHLTDASFNMWSIGTPGATDGNGYIHSFQEAYQDYFILGGSGSNIAITVGK